MYCYCCWQYSCTLCCPKQQNITCLVAIVDFIHIWSTTASFKDLVIFHRKTLQQIFYIEDQLWPAYGNSWPGARTAQTNWAKEESFIVIWIVNICCVSTILTAFPRFFFCYFTGSWNWEYHCTHLLEYLESCGTKILMRGPIICQLWWEDQLYASYDERTYCTPVMMRGPIVRQLWLEDLLHASSVWEDTEKQKNKQTNSWW